jgi:hypothetical protein
MLAGSFALVGWQEWPGFIGTVTSQHASVQPGLVSQSILGFARIRFAESGLVTPLADNGLLQHGFVAVSFLAVIGALFWLGLTGPARTSYETRLRFAFTILSMLLLLPICHMEYYILAIPLFWTLFAPGEKARPHALVIVFALLAYIAFTRPVPVSGPGLAEYREGVKSLKVSMPFFTAVWLWGTVLWEIRRVRSLAARPAREPRTVPGGAPLPA